MIRITILITNVVRIISCLMVTLLITLSRVVFLFSATICLNRRWFTTVLSISQVPKTVVGVTDFITLLIYEQKVSSLTFITPTSVASIVGTIICIAVIFASIIPRSTLIRYSFAKAIVIYAEKVMAL